MARSRDHVDAIECKWNPGSFDPSNLRTFRELHPNGRNFVVTPVSGTPYSRSVAGLEVTFTSLDHFAI